MTAEHRRVDDANVTHRRLDMRSRRILDGFTLIELVVVISIIALLVALLLPALGAAREAAKKVMCQSQLRQISIGLVMYSDDFDGVMPPHWYNASPIPSIDPENQPYTRPLAPYVGYSNDDDVYGADMTARIYICPKVDDSFRHFITGQFVTGRLQYLYEVSFGLFANSADAPKRSQYMPFASRLIGMWCNEVDGISGRYFDLITTDYPTQMHDDGGNTLFGDGHVEFARHADVTTMTSLVDNVSHRPTSSNRYYSY